MATITNMQVAGFVAIYLFIVLMGWIATRWGNNGDDHDAF